MAGIRDKRLRAVGEIALISGAASGIGRATALLLAREGACVAVTDINEAGCREVAEQVQQENGRAIWHKLDVTREADWESAIQATLDAWGGLNVLVTSAGISFAKPVADMSLEEWRRVMAVNLDRAFLGTKHAIRAMRQEGGSIVIVSSASGIKAFAGASAYCASKAALRLLAEAAALECGGDSIRINTIHPGGVETPMWRSMDFWGDLIKQHGSEAAAWKALSAGSPLQRFAKPEEIPEAILYLASNESAYVTGTELVIDGGITA